MLSLNNMMGMVKNASEHGYQIDLMLELCHWFMLLLFVGWSIFFTLTLFKFHKSRNPKADYHGVKTKASTHLEFMVVLVEAVILLGFAYPLWSQRVTSFPKEGAVHVRVIAEQFVWNFHYPGTDGKFGRQNVSLINAGNPIGLDRKDPDGADDLVVKNEMHVPVNRDVIVDVSSKDVIHSFSVEAMRVGQDAIPGLSTPVQFRPIRTGPYEIICGQLCGTNHYAMRGTIVVDTPADYESWLKDTAQMQGIKAPAKTEAATPPAK